jgi:DNA-binding CsgD family transcriptional regulator
MVEETVSAYEPEYTWNHDRLKEACGEDWQWVEKLYQGMSLERVAKELGIDEKSVEMRLFRIKQKAGK